MLLLPHFFTLCTAKPLKRVGAPCYLHFLTPLSYSTELLPPQFHWNRSMSPMPCASQSQCSVLSSSYWLLTTPDTFNHSHLETLSSLNFQGTIAYTFSCWPLLPLLLQPYGDVGLPKALSPFFCSIYIFCLMASKIIHMVMTPKFGSPSWESLPRAPIPSIKSLNAFPLQLE